MEGKIALEEHFVTAELESCITSVGWPEDEWRPVIEGLEDIEGKRLADMDRLGVEIQVLSLGSEGIQNIPDPRLASDTARRANDALAEVVNRRPDRFGGFAALALQDPVGAADELERCVKELGLKGALVNGFSDLPGGGSLYYDQRECDPFWQRVEDLGVPLYLHPRQPREDQQAIYEGREELLGASWAFAVETGTHALRLITGGVFERYPEVQVVLGHLGEQLPFAIQRSSQRIAHHKKMTLKRSLRETFRENFYVTTSGNSHTISLLGSILELGADRIMFATDYPFEKMADGAEWFDQLPISDIDKAKIGRENAARLLGYPVFPRR